MPVNKRVSRVVVVVVVAAAADTAEKFPFLENGPGSVKLTPSWEQRNLPAEELNLKGLDSEVDKAALELDEPADRFVTKDVLPFLFLHSLLL